MPRPKVAPENRQRGVRACRPCKLSKKRCDSVIPCTSCVKRSYTANCVYDPVVVVQPRRRSTESTDIPSTPSLLLSQDPSEIPIDEQRSPLQDFADNSEDTQPAPDSVSQTATFGSWNDASGGEMVREAQRESSPKGRMMVDSKGEKFYFGDSAGVSFLHFLRHVFLQSIGPCQFTENKRRDVILEVAIPDDGGTFQPQLDSGQLELLVDNFLVATSGILDLYSKEETLQIVQNLERLSGLKASIGYIVISIGAQCFVQNHTISSAERSRYFKRGQQLAFQGMLEDLNIDIIYAFLLMSFYLLGACRRNTAFLYIGIAARSAHALGLHAPEHFQHLGIEEQNFRIRAWESLRVLDLVVASVLCRPAASLAIRHDNVTFRHTREHNTRDLTLHANFRLSSILEDIVQHLDRKKGMSISAAEQFLSLLQRWSGSLPSKLRKFSVHSPLMPKEHEVAIGNLGISCLYYFAVILVTRSALISFILSRMTSATRQELGGSADSRTKDTEKLARVCVDAAVLMARTCKDALKADIILDNMCLLKAWIFTASLVLGFSKCAELETRFGVDDAFVAAVDTLKRLAQPSECPQAEHYVDVLNNLSSAAEKYQKQMESERHRHSSLYVSQILVIDGPKDVNGRTAGSMPMAESVQPELQGDTCDTMNNFAENGWYTDQSLGEGFLDGGGEVIGADWGRAPGLPLAGDPIFTMESSFRVIFDEI